LLETLMVIAAFFVGGFLLACSSPSLVPVAGQDFFPSVDSGEFTLHMVRQSERDWKKPRLV